MQQKLLPLEELAEQEKHPAPAGAEFPIHSYLQDETEEALRRWITRNLA